MSRAWLLRLRFHVALCSCEGVRGTEVVVSTFSASDSLLINSAGMGTDSGAVAGDGFGRTHRFVELAQPSLESHPVHVRHQLSLC